jgi:hypothetical protein
MLSLAAISNRANWTFQEVLECHSGNTEETGDEPFTEVPREGTIQ